MKALNIKPTKEEKAIKSTEDAIKAIEVTKVAAEGAKAAAAGGSAAAEEIKKAVSKPSKQTMKTKDATVTMQKVGADGEKGPEIPIKVVSAEPEKKKSDVAPASASTRTHVAIKTAGGMQATISMPIAEGKRATVSPSTTVIESEKFATGMGSKPTKVKDDKDDIPEKEDVTEEKEDEKTPAKPAAPKK